MGKTAERTGKMAVVTNRGGIKRFGTDMTKGLGSHTHFILRGNNNRDRIVNIKRYSRGKINHTLKKNRRSIRTNIQNGRNRGRNRRYIGLNKETYTTDRMGSRNIRG